MPADSGFGESWYSGVEVAVFSLCPHMVEGQSIPLESPLQG